MIRAAESVLEVAEHHDGCRELEKLGVIPKVLDLQRMSEDRVILTTCAGLLLALLRTDNETTGKSEARAVIGTQPPYSFPHWAC